MAGDDEKQEDEGRGGVAGHCEGEGAGGRGEGVERAEEATGGEGRRDNAQNKKTKKGKTPKEANQVHSKERQPINLNSDSKMR